MSVVALEQSYKLREHKGDPTLSGFSGSGQRKPGVDAGRARRSYPLGLRAVRRPGPREPPGSTSGERAVVTFQIPVVEKLATGNVYG